MSLPLHIVFSLSAAVDLRRALAQAGRLGDVVACADDFSFGPIDPGDPDQRDVWLDEELGLDLGRSDDDFWRQALNAERRLIAWTSTRVAKERAGFLEWLWRLGDAPCEVVDLSQARVDHHPAILPLLPAEQIVGAGLFDLARPLEAAERARHHQAWHRLKQENTPFRTIQDGELASAPLEVFDGRLLSHISSDWIPAARVVGAAWADAYKDWIFQVGDLILACRLFDLIDRGVIEERPCDDPTGMGGLRAIEVRRF
ncbi:MAG TPA: DUF3658 domain-containing protein [Caulobacter sp.]|nr:DUF3658 domain-containing protein [Caulobacter sp.]